MSVKTIRFNKQEEDMLKTILNHYRTDFSDCIKELIAEKLEDLRDIGYVKHVKEGKASDYLNVQQITALY